MKFAWLALLLLLPQMGASQTYTFSTLANFPNLSKKGPAYPSALTIDSAGNLYGVSAEGGTYNQGTVFKLTPGGVLSVLYSFGATTNDATGPYGTVIRDSKGNLYGLTMAGGTSGTGTVFKLSASGKETVLHSFTTQGGVYCPCPEPSLALDSKGNLYGYDLYTNFGHGSVFKISPAGVYSTLYSFCSLTNCLDGDQPAGGLIIKANGKLYGVTYAGGGFSCFAESGCGTIFELDTNGNETVIHSFTSNGDGASPAAKLTQDAAGNLYGTTYYGGNDYGTVFKVNASGQESVLYSFCVDADCTDGEYPESALVLDSAGNLLGIASEGGNPIYKVTPTGMESVILYPPGPAGFGNGLVMDKPGNLYGTNFGGGPAHTGTAYKLTRH